MSKNIELGPFRSLIDSVDSYSKVIEVAITIDENTNEHSHEPEHQPSLFNLYGGALQELKSTKQEEDEYKTSIVLELTDDEFSDPPTQYVHTHLANDNYNETIVVQPQMNFDDYDNYKTFAMDFMPWAQLLNKDVRVTRQVADTVPEGVTLKEFALGHILWEVTFYGFGCEQINEQMEELKELSTNAASSKTIEIEDLLKDAEDTPTNGV